MQRKKFSREFKFEAARWVSERGVEVPQAARDLDVRKTLCKWMKLFSADSGYTFPGMGR